MPKMSISPPGSRISNVVPQYCTGRFFYYYQCMVIYDYDWYVSVRYDLFRSSGGKLVKNMPKMPTLSPPESRISNIMPQYCAKTSSITMYGHIVIMTDMPACVLTWIGVYGNLLCHNWSKICQKCQFRPLDPEYPMWYLNTVPGDFSITTNVWSYMIMIDTSAYGMTCLDLQGEN